MAAHPMTPDQILIPKEAPLSATELTALPALDACPRIGDPGIAQDGPREGFSKAATRWLLGTLYAWHPKRIRTLPALTLWTLLDIARGGTREPSNTRLRSVPDTFAGIVRDLTPQSFLAALRRGFFPWCHCGPLKWWTREKRMVLFLDEHKLEKRTLREMKKSGYRFSFDTAFNEVVAACAAPRDYNRHTLTWITPRFMHLYAQLYTMGIAHSFEIWTAEGLLVGGGFGVAVGRIFFSESLFSRERDVSKMASSALYYHLAKWGFVMCDGRDYTPMQAAMGYREISRVEHEAILAANAQGQLRQRHWDAEGDLATVADWVAAKSKPAKAAKAPGPG